ncbi:MAG TPA: hypothetical protein VNZ67_04635 [bacterium]|jgi:hypothetical protein|nr:hypothetical protein [bacterium]
MTSAAERRALWLAGAAVLGLGWLAAGCSDNGPTNLYSKALFGVSQPGAHFEVVEVDEDQLSPGSDGLVVFLKNTGQGGTVGPVRAMLATTNTCATLSSYGAAAPTALFAAAGQVVQPGDILRGQAVNQAGAAQNQYSYVAAFSCTGTAIPFTITVTDPYGSSWNGAFSAMAQ